MLTLALSTVVIGKTGEALSSLLSAMTKARKPGASPSVSDLWEECVQVHGQQSADSPTRATQMQAVKERIAEQTMRQLGVPLRGKNAEKMREDIVGSISTPTIGEANFQFRIALNSSTPSNDTTREDGQPTVNELWTRLVAVHAKPSCTNPNKGVQTLTLKSEIAEQLMQLLGYPMDATQAEEVKQQIVQNIQTPENSVPSFKGTIYIHKPPPGRLGGKRGLEFVSAPNPLPESEDLQEDKKTTLKQQKLELLEAELQRHAKAPVDWTGTRRRAMNRLMSDIRQEEDQEEPRMDARELRKELRLCIQGHQLQILANEAGKPNMKDPRGHAAFGGFLLTVGYAFLLMWRACLQLVPCLFGGDWMQCLGSVASGGLSDPYTIALALMLPAIATGCLLVMLSVDRSAIARAIWEELQMKVLGGQVDFDKFHSKK